MIRHLTARDVRMIALTAVLLLAIAVAARFVPYSGGMHLAPVPWGL